MDSAAPSAWIIGGAGFLGSAVAALCRAAGWSALVVDPACSGSPCGVVGEGGVPSVVEQACRRMLPGLVFFCAASRGGDAAAYRRVFLEPVECVSAAAPQARLVFCSSAAVYEGSGDVAEESPTPGSTERLQALLAAEQAVLAAGGVVARLAALYGPGRCELLRRHMAGEPQLPGEPSRVLNYVHVEDAARALLLLAAADSLPRRVYNVCAESFTKAQASALLAELSGVPPASAVAAAGRRGRADHRVLAERLRAELGWRPHVLFRDFVRAELRLA